ncbi:MAG TPA: hypothetical protein VGQ19_17355 [Burkholderiales bacterium]|jgi:hypothetical protein|nr:hypothetical protein [Burkholderiales bacterium]
MFRNNRSKSALFICSIGLIVIFACNVPGAAAPTAVPSPASVESPAAPAPTVIQHTLIPVSLPAEHTNHAGDIDSSTTAGSHEAPGGDRFTFGQYERPFNADTMDRYFPELDILDTFTFQDDTWIYASITMRGRDGSDQLSGRYGLELDFDVDGKGDWLVLVSHPASTEWSTDGVEVWQDTNKDVGGTAAMFTDEHPAFGDGFDRMVFGSGQESDPDAAWARVAAADPNTVELAVKWSLFGNDNSYLAGMWAGNDDLDPAQFDFNDHMTHTEAGASVRGYEVYFPIKALSELDASCRVAIGFAATGNEPGLCKTIVPSATGIPGCPYTCEYGQNPYPDCTCWPG